MVRFQKRYRGAQNQPKLGLTDLKNEECGKKFRQRVSMSVLDYGLGRRNGQEGYLLSHTTYSEVDMVYHRMTPVKHQDLARSSEVVTKNRLHFFVHVIRRPFDRLVQVTKVVKEDLKTLGADKQFSRDVKFRRLWNSDGPNKMGSDMFKDDTSRRIPEGHNTRRPIKSSQIIYTDEKMFSLDGPDGCRHYWRDLREAPKVSSEKELRRWCIGWATCPPDCNPMENMWKIVVRHVYSNNRQFSTIEELKTAISNAWEISITT
ncbi:hypothetical protein RB195_010494 [Necator americanus]|uniref:Uncharacterized protein n=1 Tax=Necator americanus TaxID=51031 RepID=A0ABR1CY68_NECAM